MVAGERAASMLRTMSPGGHFLCTLVSGFVILSTLNKGQQSRLRCLQENTTQMELLHRPALFFSQLEVHVAP